MIFHFLNKYLIITVKLLANFQIFVIIILFANMAQLVEQLIRNQQVAGSNPAISSNKVPETIFGHFIFKNYFIIEEKAS